MLGSLFNKVAGLFLRTSDNDCFYFDKLDVLHILKCKTLICYMTVIGATSTAQKIKFSIKDFFRKCDHIRRKLLIW